MEVYAPGEGESLTSVTCSRNAMKILSLLGEGGMGACTRRGTSNSAARWPSRSSARTWARNRAILDRFKQELILATQVTHRNVVRIYDLEKRRG